MAIEVQVSKMLLGNTVTIFNRYFKTNFVNIVYLFMGLSVVRKDKMQYFLVLLRLLKMYVVFEQVSNVVSSQVKQSKLF